VLITFFVWSSNQSNLRNGDNSGRRRNPVVSCVTVDSDEDQNRSPQKGPQAQVISHTNGVSPVICGLNRRNSSRQHPNNYNTVQNNNNINTKAHLNPNQNIRDVKPEISATATTATPYASQKKRLLAKAQSECLIGNNSLKQEPGLNDHSGQSSSGDVDKSNGTAKRQGR